MVMQQLDIMCANVEDREKKTSKPTRSTNSIPPKTLS